MLLYAVNMRDSLSAMKRTRPALHVNDSKIVKFQGEQHLINILVERVWMVSHSDQMVTAGKVRTY